MATHTLRPLCHSRGIETNKRRVHAYAHTHTLPSRALISQKASLYRSWTDNHFTVPRWTQLDREKHRAQGNLHIQFAPS